MISPGLIGLYWALASFAAAAAWTWAVPRYRAARAAATVVACRALGCPCGGRA